jgi:hypothetical protein
VRRWTSLRKEFGEVPDEQTRGLRLEDLALALVEKAEMNVWTNQWEAAEEDQTLLMKVIAVQRRRRQLQLEEICKLTQIMDKIGTNAVQTLLNNRNHGVVIAGINLVTMMIRVDRLGH